MAYTLLKELSGYLELDLRVVVLNNGTLARQLRDSDVRLQLVDEAGLSFLQILVRTSKAVRALRPDVIHSHRYKENVLAYLSTLGYSGSPALIATQHGMPELFNGSVGMSRHAILTLNRLLLARRFQRVAAVSEDIREFLITEHGFSDVKLSVIHNGVRVPEVLPPRLQRRGLWIGSAGRFFPVKGYPFLVEVAREVSTSNNDIFFRVAGDGPQFTEVESRVKKYGLVDRVCLAGFVADMGSFYGDIDVYISTSLHEGIPMSVLEAMAHGVPVIAPRVGGFKEIITDGVEGYLIEDRNPVAFAKKCILLATNEDLRAEMSLAARRRVISDFSAERMSSQYYELYRSVASA